MGTSLHRLQTKVRPAQAERVEAYAQANLLTVSAAVRLLLARALEEDPGRATEQIALAALVAAEQSALLVALLFPHGDTRLLGLEERAIEAAELRLAQLSDRLRTEGTAGA